MQKTLSEIKEAFDAITPYIETHTSRICPSCLSVCCINRHSHYDMCDLVFINALGLDNLDNTVQGPGIPDTEPCRFLLKYGCSLPRFRRPFRCTWFFCEELLESMKNSRAKDYRRFISSLQDLRCLRLNFLRSLSEDHISQNQPCFLV